MEKPVSKPLFLLLYFIVVLVSGLLACWFVLWLISVLYPEPLNLFQNHWALYLDVAAVTVLIVMIIKRKFLDKIYNGL